jgi:hypothetical protein
MIFWLMLKLEISYRVIISRRIFSFFLEDFFENYIFCMVKYLSFHDSSFSGTLLYFCVVVFGCFSSDV